MRENFEEIKGIATQTNYSKEEINKRVSEHSEDIIRYCKELEAVYAERGIYDTYETMIVLFDLRDAELYSKILGHGISQDIVDGIEEGFIIQVYEFITGNLIEMAFEGLEYWGEGEAAELYSMYRHDEISKTEYYHKYDEVIQPWINEYIDDYLEKAVEINIDYLNALK